MNVGLAPDNPLDLHDIQGNIVKAYPRFGLPKARYFFFRVNDGQAGRRFVRDLIPLITTSAPWVAKGNADDGSAKPDVTTNVAFTYDGLWRLGVPTSSLQTFPEEFSGGMKARRSILGDDGASDPGNWDPIWRTSEGVHIFVAVNGADDAQVSRRYEEVVRLSSQQPGLELLLGHRGTAQSDLPYQEASAIFVGGQPTPQEHFGYTDGISNPFFKGALTDSANVIGGGKVTGENVASQRGWEPLETGEFILGYKDEAFEYPVAPRPNLLGDNGTYLVYRKLHQNVASFDAYLERVGRDFPGGKEALAAKFAGRWRSGAPVTTFPSEPEATAFAAKWAAAKLAISTTSGLAREAAKLRFAELNKEFVAFDYRKDLDGAGCPIGAHARRAHPRASLEFGQAEAFASPDALANRRRILRRGLPYGESQKERRDDGDHGIIFMALCASIRRQFEFVQQQWFNYSNDFRRGNDKDPLIGNHGPTDGRMLIESAAGSGRPPFFCSGIPRLVETRGGDYFFVPSLTALRMIGRGIVDPT